MSRFLLQMCSAQKNNVSVIKTCHWMKKKHVSFLFLPKKHVIVFFAIGTKCVHMFNRGKHMFVVNIYLHMLRGASVHPIDHKQPQQIWGYWWHVAGNTYVSRLWTKYDKLIRGGPTLILKRSD